MAVNVKQTVPANPPEALVEPRRYEVIDYASQIYLAVVGLIVVFFHGDRLPHWPLIVGLHGAGMVAIHFVLRAHLKWPDNHLLAFLRFIYPFLFVPLLYRETGMVNLLVTGTYYDRAFVALEEAIFGFQPVIRFAETFPSRFFAEIFYFAYFSYYGLIGGVGLALYFKERRQGFHYVSVMSLLFYVSYFTFIFVPVLGPAAIQIPQHAAVASFSYPLPPLPPTVETALFYRIMTVIHGNLQVIGAAFPSSHVAVSVGALYFAWVYFRRMRYVVLIDVVLLAFSTVYCRYHYAVDVFGGLLVAAVVIPLGERLYRRYL